MQADVVETTGRIAVGDRVTVNERYDVDERGYAIRPEDSLS